MEGVTRGLLFLGIAIAGFVLSQHYSELARKCARILAILAGIGVACLVLTGLLRTTLQPVELHHWSGHGLVIFLWLGVPFASGVMWERYFRWPALSAILQFVALLAVLAIGLLAAVTGYLGPTFHPISEEAAIRFAVLHKLFLPGILSALLLQWWWYFRPKD